MLIADQKHKAYWLLLGTKAMHGARLYKSLDETKWSETRDAQFRDRNETETLSIWSETRRQYVSRPHSCIVVQKLRSVNRN